MAFNSDEFQTIVLPKSQLKEVKRLSEKSRYPMTKLVCFAIKRLLADKAAMEEIVSGMAEDKINGGTSNG